VSTQRGCRRELTKEEFVEVTVKVPKNIMDMLEKENFFGWDKEAFFSESVRHTIGAELSEMDVDKTKRIYKEYGDDIDRIDIVKLKEVEKTV